MSERVLFEADTATEASDTAAADSQKTIGDWQSHTLHELCEVEGFMDALENAGMAMQFEANGDANFTVRWRKAA